jgi:death on curing protein
MDIEFLSKEELFSIHTDQLARYAGREGIRDPGGVESALAAPRQWMSYGQYDAADLIPGIAAAYLYAFASNQYFIDGNKRTGAVAADAFLQLNGYELNCSDDEVYRMTKLVAKKHLSREGVLEWIRDCIVPLS